MTWIMSYTYDFEPHKNLSHKQSVLFYGHPRKKYKDWWLVFLPSEHSVISLKHWLTHNGSLLQSKMQSKDNSSHLSLHLSFKSSTLEIILKILWKIGHQYFSNCHQQNPSRLETFCHQHGCRWALTDNRWKVCTKWLGQKPEKIFEIILNFSLYHYWP